MYCPESKDVVLASSNGAQATTASTEAPKNEESQSASPQETIEPESPSSGGPTEKHFRIHYGETGHSYETIVGPYLENAKEVHVEDAYIRKNHQVGNFVRLCEAIIKEPSVKKIVLVTKFDTPEELADVQPKLEDLQQSLVDHDVVLDIKVSQELHDREIRIDNGWVVKIGRGLDLYLPPGSYFDIGSNDLTLRKCRETNVDIFKA